MRGWKLWVVMGSLASVSSTHFATVGFLELYPEGVPYKHPRLAFLEGFLQFFWGYKLGNGVKVG